jgi:hypothetical protein
LFGWELLFILWNWNKEPLWDFATLPRGGMLWLVYAIVLYTQ